MTINKKTFSKRGKPKHTDYIRHYGPNIPLMIIDAKDDNHSVGAGIQQALGYTDDDTALSFPTVSGKALAAGESPDETTEGHRDIPGFCKNVSLEEIAEHGYVLTPGRYVGAEDMEDDVVPFTKKMKGLTRELATQFHESEKLQSAIRDSGSSRRLCLCRVFTCKGQVKTQNITVSRNW